MREFTSGFSISQMCASAFNRKMNKKIYQGSNMQFSLPTSQKQQQKKNTVSRVGFYQENLLL